MKKNLLAAMMFALFASSAMAQTISGPTLSTADEAKTESFMKKEGCFKCHAIDKTKKGPSYVKIADKYKGKPEGVDKILKNLTTSPKVKLEDGTEEEHKEVSLKDQNDLKVIANWVLTRKAK